MSEMTAPPIEANKQDTATSPVDRNTLSATNLLIDVLVTKMHAIAVNAGYTGDMVDTSEDVQHG